MGHEDNLIWIDLEMTGLIPESDVIIEIATLVTDAPLKESLAELAWAGVPRAPFEALCDRLGVTTLKSRPKRWAGAAAI